MSSLPGGVACLPDCTTGTFVGIASNDYQALCEQLGERVGPFSFTSTSTACAAGRLAYSFGLGGVAASIDTACSASLVALHMASQAVAGCKGSSSCGAAVCGGVMLACVPQGHAMVQVRSVRVLTSWGGV
jgi:acyl transferase domain-containing protein